MSIDIEAKLLYGIPYKDLPEDILEEVDEMLDNDDLDYASPWYDSCREAWIIGVEVILFGDSYEQAERELMIALTVPKILSGEKLGYYVIPHVS